MVTINIRTENDAFQDGRGGAEIARILRKLAKDIEHQDTTFVLINLYDENGNRVGSCKTTTQGEAHS